MPGAKLGIRCKLYRNTAVGAAAYTTPVWNEVTCIADLDVKTDWDWAEGNTRASRVKRGRKTMLDLEITGGLLVDDVDADYIAIDEACVDDTDLDLLVLNGKLDANGVRGWRSEYAVTSLSEEQKLGGLVTRALTMKPVLTANNPKRVVVTAGVPVFTDPGLVDEAP